MENYLSRRDKLYLTKKEQGVVDTYRAGIATLRNAQKLAKSPDIYLGFEMDKNRLREHAKRMCPKRDISAYL